MTVAMEGDIWADPSDGYTIRVVLLERGFGPDTHYLLGRRRGRFPLRVGSRPAVEALLAELKTQWHEYRRASNPEYRIEGLRAIRRAPRKGAGSVGRRP